MAIIHELKAEKMRHRAEARQGRRAAAKLRRIAATVVQSVRRGMLARLEVQLARRERAAVTLQKVWRGANRRSRLQARAGHNLKLLKARQLALIEHNQQWLERSIRKRREALNADDAKAQEALRARKSVFSGTTLLHTTTPAPAAPESHAQDICAPPAPFHAPFPTPGPGIAPASQPPAAVSVAADHSKDAELPFWRSSARQGPKHGSSSSCCYDQHSSAALPKPPPAIDAPKPPPAIDDTQSQSPPKAPAAKPPVVQSSILSKAPAAKQPPKPPPGVDAVQLPTPPTELRRPRYPSGPPGVLLPSRPMHVKHLRTGAQMRTTAATWTASSPATSSHTTATSNTIKAGVADLVADDKDVSDVGKQCVQGAARGDGGGGNTSAAVEE